MTKRSERSLRTRVALTLEQRESRKKGNRSFLGLVGPANTLAAVSGVFAGWKGTATSSAESVRARRGQWRNERFDHSRISLRCDRSPCDRCSSHGRLGSPIARNGGFCRESLVL